MNIIAIRLKELRKEKKVSQLELASFLNMTRSAYSHYETGKYEPNNITLLKLSQYYNITTDYLFGNTDSKLSPEEIAFVEDIDLSNTELLKKYNLHYDEHKLSEDELEHILNFVKLIAKEKD